MKVDIIQLENIRSHLKSTVPFARGFNCLVGGLGCGKSSILYSIDFALFGEPVGRSFDYLLREGTDSAKVTLQFSQNGNTYKLIRGIKRKGKGIGQDLELLKLYQDEKLIASMNTTAIAEQLKAITGLDRDLWRQIVWVKQEHLKELIDAPPRDRQRRLDELFGLSDYEIAWCNIAEYQREYEAEKRVLERDPDVTGREKLSSEYNRITEEYTLLEMDLQDTVENLSVSKRRLEEADAQLKKLEEKKRSVEELKQKEAKLNAHISNSRTNLNSLNQTIEGKKTVIKNIEQRLNSIEIQLKDSKTALEEADIQPNQSIDLVKSQLQVLEEKISGLRAEQEATKRNMQTDQKRMNQLSTESENRCPVCLQMLNDEYKSAMMKRIQVENRDRQEAIRQLQIEIDSLQKNKNKATEAFSNMQTITARSEDLRTRLGEEEANLADLSHELEEKQRQEKDLIQQMDSIRLDISRFDLADLESARKKREQAFRQYYQTESELRTMENRKKDLLNRLDEIKERIDYAMQKLERVEKIGRAVQIIGAIRDAYRSIQPKLRSEFVKVLRNFVQQVLDGLIGKEATMLNIDVDETYTPFVKSESGVDREVANLSGGERTLLAFAYRLGLGQLIMQSRTGHGLGLLLLDEPTESLGREDGSIDRLAEAISRFKAIEQIIAVTHSEAFAEKAEHVIQLEKEAGISKVSIGNE